jgi:hypothetical protein
MKLINISSSVEMTKTTMQEKAKVFVQAVASGNVSALHMYIQAKYLNEVTAQIIEGLKAPAYTEAEQYNAGERVILGVDFDTRKGSERLDYEADPEYARLKEQLKEREALLKQAVKVKGKVIDETTGEMVPSVPVMVNPSSLVITFRK